MLWAEAEADAELVDRLVESSVGRERLRQVQMPIDLVVFLQDRAAIKCDGGL